MAALVGSTAADAVLLSRELEVRAVWTAGVRA